VRTIDGPMSLACRANIEWPELARLFEDEPVCGPARADGPLAKAQEPPGVITRLHFGGSHLQRD
jgi:hypothetical protein